MGVWSSIFDFASRAWKGAEDSKAKDRDIAAERDFLREAGRRQRTQDLQDRQRTERDVANYGQFYTGAPVQGPQQTDIGAMLDEEDAVSAPKPAAKPSKSKGFARRIGG